MLQDSIFDGKEENIIVIERNMSYEAVILDNYLEAIESEINIINGQVKLSVMQMFQTGVEK